LVHFLKLLKICFFGFLKEDIANRIISFANIGDHIIFVDEENNIQVMKLGNKEVTKFLIRKVADDSNPKLRVFSYQNEEFDSISKILDLFNFNPFPREFPKLKYFHKEAMDKHNAKELMEKEPVGSYFLRLSTNSTENIVLSYKEQQKEKPSYRHIYIKEEGTGIINIGDDIVYLTLSEFISSNKILNNPIYCKTRFLNLDLPIDNIWLAEDGGLLSKAPGRYIDMHGYRLSRDFEQVQFMSQKTVSSNDEYEIDMATLISLIKNLEEKDITVLKNIKQEYSRLYKLFNEIEKLNKQLKSYF